MFGKRTPAKGPGGLILLPLVVLLGLFGEAAERYNADPQKYRKELRESRQYFYGLLCIPLLIWLICEIVAALR
jgi:hypothetical protein